MPVGIMLSTIGGGINLNQHFVRLRGTRDIRDPTPATLP